MDANRITVWVQVFRDRDVLQLQWIDESGKRRTRSSGTASRDEAEQKRADLEYELNHGLHTEPSRLSWQTFRQMFEAEFVSARRVATRKNYRITLNLFEEHCSPRNLSSITERTVSAFAAALRHRKGNSGPQAPGTVRVRLQFLRTVLRWATAQKLLPACPRFPSVKVPKRKPQPVPVEDFDQLLKYASSDPQMRAYLLCGWLAGLRLCEALALSWDRSDVVPWLDTARQRIILPATFAKADEDQWIPLDPVLAEAMGTLPRHPDGKVFHFIEERSGKPIGHIAVSARVRELALAAGLEGVTMRTLRRGFGCYYAGKVPAQVLQRLMRHSSIKVTMDYYANIDAAIEDAVTQRDALRNKTDMDTESFQGGSGGKSSSDTTYRREAS